MSAYPYYSLDEAKAKLWAAIREGRVRVSRGDEMLTGEPAIAAIESDDRSVAIVAADILREFPPLAPGGNA